jgi:hypothetical protein
MLLVLGLALVLLVVVPVAVVLAFMYIFETTMLHSMMSRFVLLLRLLCWFLYVPYHVPSKLKTLPSLPL